MQETLYLKIEKNIEFSKEEVRLGDIATIWCTDKNITSKVKTIKIMNIPNVKEGRYVVSVMKVIQLINEMYPNVDVNNIGESDFIIDYEIKHKVNSIFNFLKVVGVSLLTFVGSGYAIMAYNNDVGTDEILEKAYTMFADGRASEAHILEIMFSIGLTLGIIIFYNHFCGKKFSSDPTPLQVEMDAYETQLDDALINRSSAAGKEQTC